jgi:hypothetical protein
MGKCADPTFPRNVGTYVSDLHCIKLVCAAVWGDAIKGRLIHRSYPFCLLQPTGNDSKTKLKDQALFGQVDLHFLILNTLVFDHLQ